VIKLGTQRHRKLLDGIDDMTAIGCFALTELGYGNNAVEMETTAKYVTSSDYAQIHNIKLNFRDKYRTRLQKNGSSILLLSSLKSTGSLMEPFMLNGRSFLPKPM
jgi:hypothetical protein